MRIILSGLLVLGICGCTKVKKSEPVADKTDDQQTNDNPKRRAPGGVAGMILPGDDEPRRSSNGGQNNNPPPPPSNNETIPNAPPKIVEWPKYGKEHPNVVLLDPKVKGFDPFSSAASAYVNIPARVEGLAAGYNAQLQSQINAIDGGKDPQPLSYKAFMNDYKKSGRRFKSTRPYRLYGYNPQTGKVVLLVDKAMKEKIYKEKGIPLD